MIFPGRKTKTFCSNSKIKTIKFGAQSHHKFFIPKPYTPIKSLNKRIKTGID